MPDTSNPPLKIAPSILSADFTKLGDEVKAAEAGQADQIHIDVMDGTFVPNISMGPLVVEAVNRVTDLPLDVHLMIVNPEKYIEVFADAGADIISVHVEACPDLRSVVFQIKDRGKKAGVAINPGTAISAVDDILGDVDVILVMSVNPGFGGQSFIETTYDRLKVLRSRVDKLDRHADIEVDGGVTMENAGKIIAAGANILVAGNTIFSAPEGISAAAKNLRQNATTN